MDSSALELQQYLPLWSYMRSMPFKRAPYTSSTYEMAIGEADELLRNTATEKANFLLEQLRDMIFLVDDSDSTSSCLWTPISGLWIEAASQFQDPQAEPRSKLPRAKFSTFWERDLTPYIYTLRNAS